MEIKRTADDVFEASMAGISNAELDSMEKEFDALVAGITVNDLNKMEVEFNALFGESNNSSSNNNNDDSIKKQCCDAVSTYRPNSLKFS